MGSSRAKVIQTFFLAGVFFASQAFAYPCGSLCDEDPNPSQTVSNHESNSGTDCHGSGDSPTESSEKNSSPSGNCCLESACLSFVEQSISLVKEPTKDYVKDLLFASTTSTFPRTFRSPEPTLAVPNEWSKKLPVYLLTQRLLI